MKTKLTYDNLKIANIQQSVLEKFDLQRDGELEIPAGHKPFHFLAIPCKNKQEEKFVFKIQITSYPWVTEQFQNEIRINRLMTNDNWGIAPVFIDGNEITEPCWMLYKFEGGRMIGDWYKISDDFLKESVIDDLLEKINKMQSFSKSAETIITQKYVEDFLNKRTEILSDMIFSLLKNNTIDKEIADKNISFYKNHNKIPLKFSHNDLHPANIISDGKTIKLLDFFFCSFYNPLFDPIYIYLCAIRNKRISDKILEQIFNQFPDIKTPDSSQNISFKLALIDASARIAANANYFKKDLEALISKNDPRKEEWEKEIESIEKAKKYFIRIFCNLDREF